MNIPSKAKFIDIALGEAHACGIRTNGSIICWGSPNKYIHETPLHKVTTVTVDKARSLGWHSCGVRTDGSLVCWGKSLEPFSGPDALLYGYTATAPPDKLQTVSTGADHTCGIRVDGTVVCWGDNTVGQLVAPSGVFTSVSAGTRHSCGIRLDGSVECWGSNTIPQWDAGTESVQQVYGGQLDAPPDKFVDVSAGQWHSCGITSDGAAVCWGNNFAGQLVAPSGVFTSVSAGTRHSCGLLLDGSVECWGSNTMPQWDGGTESYEESVTVDSWTLLQARLWTCRSARCIPVAFAMMDLCRAGDRI